jgi:1-acyl-sn-glycerol-3-phosphate acyltransferase
MARYHAGHLQEEPARDVSRNKPVGWKRMLGSLVLRAMGFRIEGRLPACPKFVMIGAPHTSNWDFVLTLACKWALGVHASYLGKASLFRGLLGRLFLATGGIPVERSSPQDMVAQVVRRFDESERLILAVAPEGTRSRRERWKSGFYHIALGAGVPVVCGGFDFARRRVVLSDPVSLTGDVRADMDRIRRFYAPLRGRHPHVTTPPLLRAEAEATPEPVAATR